MKDRHPLTLGQIEEIKAGGLNYLSDSTSYIEISRWEHAASVEATDEGDFVRFTSLREHSASRLVRQTAALEKGDYFLSMRARSPKVGAYLRFNSGVNVSNIDNVITDFTTDFSVLKWRFTVNADNTNTTIRLYFEQSLVEDDYFDVEWVMIEKANVGGDWKPSLLDLQNYIPYGLENNVQFQSQAVDFENLPNGTFFTLVGAGSSNLPNGDASKAGFLMGISTGGLAGSYIFSEIDTGALWVAPVQGYDNTWTKLGEGGGGGDVNLQDSDDIEIEGNGSSSQPYQFLIKKKVGEVPEKNRYVEYANNDGDVIFRLITHIWDGTEFVFVDVYDNYGESNIIGKDAGHENIGEAVQAMGNLAANQNEGDYVVALGNTSASNNTGNKVNALGFMAAANNSGADVNALGEFAGYGNEGSGVNALGGSSAYGNSGDQVNALGQDSARNNSGESVNAIGRSAAQNNTGDDVNVLGFRSLSQNSSYSRVNIIGNEVEPERADQSIITGKSFKLKGADVSQTDDEGNEAIMFRGYLLERIGDIIDEATPAQIQKIKDKLGI